MGHGARRWVWASLPQGLASGWSRGRISGPEAGEGFVPRGLVATGSGGLPLGLLGIFLQLPSEPACRPVLPGQPARRGFIGVGAAIKGVSSRHRLHLPAFRLPTTPKAHAACLKVWIKYRKFSCRASGRLLASLLLGDGGARQEAAGPPCRLRGLNFSHIHHRDYLALGIRLHGSGVWVALPQTSCGCRGGFRHGPLLAGCPTRILLGKSEAGEAGGVRSTRCPPPWPRRRSPELGGHHRAARIWGERRGEGRKIRACPRSSAAPGLPRWSLGVLLFPVLRPRSPPGLASRGSERS